MNYDTMNYGSIQPWLVAIGVGSDFFLRNSEFRPPDPRHCVFFQKMFPTTNLQHRQQHLWHWNRRNHHALKSIDNNSTAPLEEKRGCTAVSQASELTGHNSHRMDLAISAVRGKMTRALEEGTLLGDDAFLRDVASARAIFKDLDTQGRSLTPQEVSALPCYTPSWGEGPWFLYGVYEPAEAGSWSLLCCFCRMLASLPSQHAALLLCIFGTLCAYSSPKTPCAIRRKAL